MIKEFIMLIPDRPLMRELVNLTQQSFHCYLSYDHNEHNTTLQDKDILTINFTDKCDDHFIETIIEMLVCGLYHFELITCCLLISTSDIQILTKYLDILKKGCK